jgi:RHS repeat-associated protein
MMTMSPSSSTVTRALCAALATLLFWTPLATTVARAQESAGDEAAPDYASRSVSGAGDEVAREIATGKVGERSEAAARESTAAGYEAKDDPVKPGRGDDPEPAPQTEPDPNPAEPLLLPSGPAKTAVTPQQVVLPKGEGSIEGMGESFTPNLSSGTGTFSVPVALPKGRAGVQPSLALSYATSGGNGPVGMGWSLGVPFISRQTDKGLPRYVDEAAWHGQEDRFMYNGGQELVPVDSAAASAVDGAPVPPELGNWQQYRARVEGGFMRFFRAPDSSRWVVQSKDGTRFEFGACGASASPCTRAVVSDPEDDARIFSWQLVRMSDVRGSTVYYRYLENAGTLYVSSIDYTSPASCGVAQAPTATRECAAGLEQYAHHVGFVYETRADVTSSYITTWRTEQALRLKRIEVTSAAETVGSRFLVRRYHLRYDGGSYHSLLTEVQVEGRPSRLDGQLGVMVGDASIAQSALDDRIVGELLPPMRFSYSAPKATTKTVAGFGGLDGTVHVSKASPGHSANEGRVDFFDVNSDGLPDVLVTDPARYEHGAGVFFNGFARSTPGDAGDFSEGMRVGIPEGLSGTLTLSSLNILPMDVDGDGRSDVLHMPRQANYGYFVLSKEPVASGRSYEPLEGWSFHHVTNLLPKGVTDPRIDLGKDGTTIKTLDVNNDHLIDVVRTSGTAVQAWLNLGRYPGGEGRFGSASFRAGAWALSTLPVESCLPFSGRNLDFGERGVRIADMNGDGLQDVVKVAPDDVVWWPGRGEGAFGAGPRSCDDRTRGGRELRMQNPPRELNGELSGLHMVDVNSDGATDLVQVGFSDVSVWFNRGGEGFTDRVVIANTPGNVDALERVRIADIDGSGTTDIIYAEARSYRWIDPMGGQRPRLLTRVDNGLGALTTLEYSTSIEDYLRDLAESQSCDPASLECFTWQREPLLPGEREGDCDARVMAKSKTCVHRAGGSPVVSTVVRRVTTTDRLEVLGAEPTLTVTEYRYHDGYYEGIEQEFRGFGAADAIAIGDEYEGTSITRTHFHQGKRPNDIAADRLADNPNEALKGREFLTEVFDESGKVLKTSHATYAVRALMQGLNGVGISYAYVRASDEYRYDTVPTQRAWRPATLDSVVRERATTGLLGVAEAPAEAGDAKHVVAVRHERYAQLRTTIDLVDNVGNLRTQTAWGRGGRGEFSEVVSDERIVAHSEPQRIDDYACGNTGWLWRTARSYVTGAAANERFGDTQQVYDFCGNQVLSLRSATLPTAYDFSGDGSAQSLTQTNSQETASAQFDVWGQPLRSCGGADLTAGTQNCLRYGEVSYDEAYGELVTRESIQATPTLTLSTSATWDRGLGVLNTATDPNGYVSEVSYDGLGRLTATLLPNVEGCGTARVPTTRIQYELTTSPALQPLSRVRTVSILSCVSGDHPDSQLEAYAYVDGLGRPRAALAEGESDGLAWEDGRPHAYTRSGLQLFTRKGQVRQAYQPSYFDGSPDDFAAVLAPPSVPYTRARYDAFGRPTLSINEDGSYKSISYHALSTDVCDEVDNGQACLGEGQLAGTCTTQRTDGHGRTIDQHLRQRTREGQDEHHRLFSYYRADGSVTRIVRALTPRNALRPDAGYSNVSRSVERRFIYDSLGRRIASEDPDTDDRAQSSAARRSWRYLFNGVGDLVAVRDPRGCGQNFYYDLAGRLVGEAYVGCAEAQLGEVASSDVPPGSVGMGRTTSSTPVHARYVFDGFPAWAKGLVPTSAAAVLGRATGGEDRAQRSIVAYDARGNVTFAARQVAVISEPRPLTDSTTSDGRPASDAAGESPNLASVSYDALHTYTRSATFDHAGRTLTSTYPIDPDYAGTGTAPVLSGRMQYYNSGAPKSAELGVDGTYLPVVQHLRYTRDGLPSGTVYGDEGFTGRTATESRVLYDARRRPIQLFTSRTPAAERTPQTLGSVTEVMHQRLSWDGSSNLCAVDDRRPGSEWPEGHKPYDQTIYHDALYRVASVQYAYHTPTKEDFVTEADGTERAPDWRDEEARHREADPMRPEAPEMVSSPADRRVIDLEYSHDWLANMTSWHDDAEQFYERSVGEIVNGNNVGNSSATPALRPAAVYLASNLADAPAGEGGYVELDYGKSGNVLAMTVHGQCDNAGANVCRDPGGTDLSARRSALRTSCACEVEQHYVYRWDELNRLHEARRYDREDAGAWQLAARQRYRYDAANQRVVKQTFEVTDGDDGAHRVALYVYPGDFERRGLVAGYDRYLASTLGTVAAPSERVSEPPQDGLQSWIRGDACTHNPTRWTACQNLALGGRADRGDPPDPLRVLLVSPDGMKGQPTLVQDGSRFPIFENRQASTPIATEFVVAAVFAIDGEGHHYPIVSTDTTTAPGTRDRWVLYARAGTETATLYWESHEDYGKANITHGSLQATIPLHQPVAAVVRSGAGGTDLFVNGTLVAHTSEQAQPTAAIQGIWAGKSGRFADGLIYTRALDDAELSQLHRYLSDRYGIPIEGAAPIDAVEQYNDTETQYLIAGARVVWKNRARQSTLLDPEQRITFAVTNLIQSTSAVIELTTGELVEVGGFYPNGAREEQLGASDEVGGAALPFEPVGFTGKEADEEVGLVYFGERYLIPRIGRWATPDPLSVHAAGGGEAGNSYHYVSGNLLQARDPLGLEVEGSTSEQQGWTNTNQAARDANSKAAESVARGMFEGVVETLRGIKDLPKVPGRLRELDTAIQSEVMRRAELASMNEVAGQQDEANYWLTRANEESVVRDMVHAAAGELAEEIRADPLRAAGQLVGGLVTGAAIGRLLKAVKSLGAVELAPSGASGARNRAVSQAGGVDARPFRSINQAHPPNALAHEAMRRMVIRPELDCSDIASALNRRAGTGKILEVRPKAPGTLKLMEDGVLSESNFFHQVYTDGKYVFDPRLSQSPVPLGDWTRHMKALNPDGIAIGSPRPDGNVF